MKFQNGTNLMLIFTDLSAAPHQTLTVIFSLLWA